MKLNYPFLFMLILFLLMLSPPVNSNTNSNYWIHDDSHSEWTTKPPCPPSFQPLFWGLMQVPSSNPPIWIPIYQCELSNENSTEVIISNNNLIINSTSPSPSSSMLISPKESP